MDRTLDRKREPRNELRCRVHGLRLDAEFRMHGLRSDRGLSFDQEVEATVGFYVKQVCNFSTQTGSQGNM